METLNRKTASDPSATRKLATLTSGVRALWSMGLPARAPEREQLITELTQLDLAVERLTIRASCHDSDENSEEVTSRADELIHLERRWYHAVAAGLSASMIWSDPGQSRFAWAPVASILGPLWVPVALDQRLGADRGGGRS